ncbi:MAG: peptidylprolyl isomerase [Lactobacillaceae bacterium]|jgi:peptidyl-prolyl cis-trans isomerase A (cyclophilin A)|nr:peptidylprolyl isomerase [Lactobacillaceae bacterium]
MKKLKSDTGLVIGIVALAFVVVIIAIAVTVTPDDSGSTTSSSAETSSKKVESKAKLNKEKLPQLSDTVAADESEIVMHTTDGDITIKLFNKYAPLAVKNFIVHAKAGYYKNTTFHRVIKDFMIQGGDPNSATDPTSDTLGQGGESIYAPGAADADKKIDSGSGFKNETNYNLYNIRGALAMANAGADTNGSQFYIVQNNEDVTSQIDKNNYPTKIYDAYKKGGYPAGDGGYTVFGQVIKGMDVVDKIANAETKASSTGESSVAVNPVKITSIDVTKEAKTKK